MSWRALSAFSRTAIHAQNVSSLGKRLLLLFIHRGIYTDIYLLIIIVRGHAFHASAAARQIISTQPLRAQVGDVSIFMLYNSSLSNINYVIIEYL
jgi:hypothetical protein